MGEEGFKLVRICIGAVRIFLMHSASSIIYLRCTKKASSFTSQLRRARAAALQLLHRIVSSFMSD